MNKELSREIKKHNRLIKCLDLARKAECSKITWKNWRYKFQLGLSHFVHRPSLILCYFGFHKFAFEHFLWKKEDVGRIGFHCERCSKLFTYIALDDMPEYYRDHFLKRIKEFREKKINTYFC